MSSCKCAVLIPLIAVVAVACGPSISVTRDSSLPIYPRTTYAWGLAETGSAPARRNPRVDPDSVRARIERAVDAELQRRGFLKVAFADAQLIVHYHIGVRTRVDTVPEAYAGTCVAQPCLSPKYAWGYWGEPERTVREVRYTEGSLMLDFLSRPTMQVAWRGFVTGEARPEATTDVEIRRVVGRLLSAFPGKG